MRYFCIADERDVLTGMRLAGIEGVMASTAREVDAATEKAAADAGIGILLVTENCYALCREKLDALRLSASRPLVSVISGSRGEGREENSITRLIDEAIGIKL